MSHADPNSHVGELSAQDTFLVQVLWDFAQRQDNDLPLAAGDVVRVLRVVDDDWYLGESPDGERGFFPATYGVALTPAQPVLTLAAAGRAARAWDVRCRSRRYRCSCLDVSVEHLDGAS